MSARDLQSARPTQRTRCSTLRQPVVEQLGIHLDVVDVDGALGLGRGVHGDVRKKMLRRRAASWAYLNVSTIVRAAVAIASSDGLVSRIFFALPNLFALPTCTDGSAEFKRSPHTGEGVNDFQDSENGHRAPSWAHGPSG
jgi:hypothetical protein